jgi:hypothetical protein
MKHFDDAFHTARRGERSNEKKSLFGQAKNGSGEEAALFRYVYTLRWDFLPHLPQRVVHHQ